MRAAVAGTVAVGLVAGGAVAVAPAAQAATIPTPPAVCQPRTLNTTPILDNFTFAPTSVNVTSGAKTFVVTATAHDTVALTSITVTFGASVGLGRTYGTLKRVSGSATNGTWKGTLTVPRWVASGAWRVQFVSLLDTKGGYASYTPAGGFHTPSGTTTWGAGWPTTLTVTSVPDLTPPVFTKLTLSKKAVKTTATAAKVKVTAVVKDSQSGVASAALYAYVSGAPKSLSVAAFLVRTRVKDTWAGTLTIPTWVGKGKRTWSLQISATDRVGLYTSMPTAAIKAKKWQSTLKVTSKTDSAKPTLASLSFAPTSVNATTGAKRVAFTLKANDAASGMSSAGISFRSPNGYSTSATITKVTGSPKSRTYTGYVTVPQCGDPGTWKANVYLYDVWGFNNFYSPAALAAKRLPVNLSVVDLDAVAPTVSGPSTLHAGQSVTVKFSEPVLFKNSIASTIRTRVNFSDAPGTWVCKNGSAAVVTCDANGANVVTATWTPTTPLTVGQSVSMQAQAVYPAPTGIYDRTGNALSYLYVGVTVT